MEATKLLGKAIRTATRDIKRRAATAWHALSPERKAVYTAKAGPPNKKKRKLDSKGSELGAAKPSIVLRPGDRGPEGSKWTPAAFKRFKTLNLDDVKLALAIHMVPFAEHEAALPSVGHEHGLFQRMVGPDFPSRSSRGGPKRDRSKAVTVHAASGETMLVSDSNAADRYKMSPDHKKEKWFEAYKERSILNFQREKVEVEAEKEKALFSWLEPEMQEVVQDYEEGNADAQRDDANPEEEEDQKDDEGPGDNNVEEDPNLFECEYDCGFDGPTLGLVEAHESKCSLNPAISEGSERGNTMAPRGESATKTCSKAELCTEDDGHAGRCQRPPSAAGVDPNPFECEYDCGFDGPNQDIVEEHELACVNNPDNRMPSVPDRGAGAGLSESEIVQNAKGRFNCPHCDKDFSHKRFTEKHLEKSCTALFPQKKKEFPCAWCSASFTDTSNMRTHMRNICRKKPESQADVDAAIASTLGKKKAVPEKAVPVVPPPLFTATH